MAIETLGNSTPLITTRTGDYFADAVTDGYVYECSCGELYNDVFAAYSCRKCRNYCVFGTCTHVTDVRTGEVVMGKVPSDEEYAEAEAAAQVRWAEERAELELREQMWRQEGELYEAEMRRRKEEELQQRRDEEEEQMWELQDQWDDR